MQTSYLKEGIEIFMDSKKTSNPKTKSRGKFYLLVLSAIAISALVGACACEDSPALELSYPPIVGTIHPRSEKRPLHGAAISGKRWSIR